MRIFATLALTFALAVPAFAGEFNKVVSIGDKAPTFSGIPATFKGEDTSLSLADIEEDVVVLVFLGNHCPFVVAIEDYLNEFAEENEGKSVKLVGVSVNDLESDKLPAIKEWVERNNSQYVYGYDDTQKIGREYGATNTPQFFVIDSERTIRYMGAMYSNPMNVKPTDVNYVQNAVDALLTGGDIEVTETRPIGCGVRY